MKLSQKSIEEMGMLLALSTPQRTRIFLEMFRRTKIKRAVYIDMLLDNAKQFYDMYPDEYSEEVLLEFGRDLSAADDVARQESN